MSPTALILTPLIATAATAVFFVAPGAIVPLWWAWTWLIEGPHLVATWTRAYADASDRVAHKRELVMGLVWMSPGLIALIVSKALGSHAPFLLFLLFAGLWSWHHTVRQHFGIMALLGRRARTPKTLFAIDKWFLYSGAWLAFFAWVFTHPAPFRIAGPPQPLALAPIVVIAAAYTVHVVWRWRAHQAVIPALFTWSVIVGMHCTLFLVFGRLEPIWPGAGPSAGPDQIFAATAIAVGVVHGTQYLALYFAVERRRAELTPRGGWSDRLAQAPVLAWVAFALISVGYVVLSAGRGLAPGYALFALDSDATRIGLALYWGVFFHHYYLDQFLWRPGSDARLRRELDLV